MTATGTRLPGGLEPPRSEGARWAVARAGFGLSGASALLFQTAWTQELGLVFGASELAVISVLAAFMAGLAVGSHLGGRWAPRLRRPLLLYGLAEGAIGVYALALPSLLRAASWAQSQLLEADGFDLEAGLPWRTALQTLGAAVLLFPPTLLMGISLPLLVRSAVADRTIGERKVGALYAINTLGAALGAVLAGFLLIPRFGLGRAIFFGVGACFAIAIASAVAARGELLGRSEPGCEPEPSGEAPGGLQRWPLAIAAIAGAAALSLEVVWTRLLTYALGGSIYSFSTMLATFLLAIAAGTALVSRRSRSAEEASLALMRLLLAAGVATALALAGAELLPAMLSRLARFGGPHAVATLLAAALMFPFALSLGACFPLAVRAYARGGRTTAAATGAVLAANTAGAVTGVVATGLFLLPALGFAGATILIAGTTLAGALALALLRIPRARGTAIVAGVAAAALALFPPPTPWSLLRMSPTALFAAAPVAASDAADRDDAGRFSAFGRVEFAGVGRSATVLVHRDGLEWRLASNGLPESAIQPRGGRVARYAVARWLTLLPAALRPAPTRMLVIGLGAGHSVEGLPASISAIDVVELEPQVVLANRALADRRRSDPLAEPRLQLHLGDGRTALSLRRERFDAIVSQPSHPWTAGSASLFTQEFFQLAHARLVPGGIFVQWIGLDFVDLPLLRSLVATLRAVFPFVECYRPYPGGAMLFVASDREVDDFPTAADAIARDGAAWNELGVSTLEDFLLARVLSDAGSRRFAEGGEITRDLRNLLQTRSPRVLGHPPPPAEIEAALAPFDALRSLPRGADGAYVVRRLLEEEAPARALRVATELRDATDRRRAFAWLDFAGYAPVGGGSSRGKPSGASDAGVEEEILAARLARLAGTAPPSGLPHDVADWAGTHAPAAAWLEASTALAAGDLTRWPEMDARLAAVAPRDPLYEVATRTRIALRLASGAPAAAAEVVAMVDWLLARRVTAADLLLRARVGIAAGQPWVALAALDELVRTPQRDARARFSYAPLARRSLAELTASLPRRAEAERAAARELAETLFAGVPPTGRESDTNP